MLSQWLLATLDTGINALLKLDPVSQQQLGALAGQVVAIDCREPELRLYLVILHDGIQLARHWETDADCTLSAPAAQLLQLGVAANKVPVLHHPQVSIHGNSALLTTLVEIFQAMDIDWEYQLSEWLGPLPTALLSQRLKQGGRWSRSQLTQGHQLMADFITEEARLLVGQQEAQSRFNELDKLKLQLDQLDARTALLAQRIRPAQ